MVEAREKVARAICTAMGNDPDAIDGRGDPEVPGGFESWPMWAECQDLADAAIAAHLEALGESGYVVVCRVCGVSEKGPRCVRGTGCPLTAAQGG